MARAFLRPPHWIVVKRKTKPVCSTWSALMSWNVLRLQHPVERAATMSITRDFSSVSAISTWQHLLSPFGFPCPQCRLGLGIANRGAVADVRRTIRRLVRRARGQVRSQDPHNHSQFQLHITLLTAHARQIVAVRPELRDPFRTVYCNLLPTNLFEDPSLRPGDLDVQHFVHPTHGCPPTSRVDWLQAGR